MVCTAIMTCLYGGLGAIGYWSRGDAITGIVIFSLGDTLQARIASALILVQVGVGVLWFRQDLSATFHGGSRCSCRWTGFMQNLLVK